VSLSFLFCFVSFTLLSYPFFPHLFSLLQLALPFHHLGSDDGEDFLPEPICRIH